MLPMNEKILKYVPRRLKPHVVGCDHDSDGYWVWFDGNVMNTLYDGATVHEDTIAELKQTLKDCVVTL